MTEDADLGLRLARFGYRSRMITRPTFEDCTEEPRVWLGQRTRWLKGWMQTWLVHMRHPMSLLRETGWASFAIVQIMLGGMVVSALFHPLMIATALWIAAMMLAGGEVGTYHLSLLAIDLVNIVCGYGAFFLLGWKTLVPRERKGFWKAVTFMPVYWLAMSWAGWRALGEILVAPHHWEKTEHRPRRRRPVVQEALSPPRRKAGPSPMIAGSSRPIARVSRPS